MGEPFVAYVNDAIWEYDDMMPSIFNSDGYDFDFFALPQIPQVEEPEKSIGHHAEVLTFYEGPKKCECCTNWVEKQPTQMPGVAKERYNRAAILIFKGKDHKSGSATVGGLVALEDSFIEIQSQIIANLIRPILAELGRLMPAKEKIKFTAPFRELFYAHPKVVQLQQKYKPRTRERDHLNVLVRVMEELFSEVSSEARELQSKRIISSELLWTIFPKNMIVYARRDGHDRLYQVDEIDVLKHSRNTLGGNWTITCRYVQFDGVRYGTSTVKFRVPKFDGVRKITSLPVYPVGFHSDPQIEQRHISLGKKLLEYQHIAHREYDGVGRPRLHGEDSDDNEYEDDDDDYWYRRRKRNFAVSNYVNGRVIIDTFGFNKFNPGRAIETKPLDWQGGNNSGPNNGEDDPTTDPTGRNKFHNQEQGRLNSEEQELNRNFLLKNPQYLLLMSPWLPGFSLKRNQWFWLSIKGLRPVTWNSGALDHLVIPDQRKSLLLAFVQNHVKAIETNDDVISGKGQGLVVLLSGPPGTGKTLTAEAVADKTRKPLFRLQAESLGTKPEGLGRALSDAFELSIDWNAVMLLDEADSFLGKRSLANDNRSDVVAVILRQLEYYQGIIFLTTNLLEHIDDAFRSRIHFHFCYPPLSFESRRILWDKFLTRPPLEVKAASQTSTGQARAGNGTATSARKVAASLTPQELDALSAWQLNGREIKNIVKTVYLWCQYNAMTITLARLEEGIHSTSPFAQSSVKDQLDTHRAQKRIRMD